MKPLERHAIKMIVDAQSSGASNPVVAGCDDWLAGAACGNVTVKIGLVSVGVKQLNAIFLNTLLNLADRPPVCPALAMHHAHTQAAAARAFIKFNIGGMNVVKDHQAILAAGLLLAGAEIQQHVFR